MSYFLLVYDRAQGRLTRDVEQFSETERQAALRKRFKLELDEREHPDVEVVLLGADSLDALKLTHARYFKTFGELVSAAQGD